MLLQIQLFSSSLSVTAQFKGAAPLKKPSFQLGALSYRLRATSQLLPPRTRVARIPQKKRLHLRSAVFLGAPHCHSAACAKRPHLSCVRSFHFPPLPRPTCFLAAASFDGFRVNPEVSKSSECSEFFAPAQFSVYGFYTMPQHQYSDSRFPKGALA